MTPRALIVAEFLDAGHDFIRQAAPRRSSVFLRWNAASSADLVLPQDHPVIDALVSEDGARCAVWMVRIHDGGLTKRILVEGRVGQIRGEGAPFGSVTVPVVDDWQELSSLLGFQVPAAGTGGQGAAEFARYTGTSEANAKAAIAANIARLGKPWDVAPSLGRGTVSPIDLRMDKLAEKIIAPLVNDRLQLTLTRNRETGRYLVDTVAGAEFPRPITPESGVLSQWSWVKQPPTATRAVIGGPGRGTERVFSYVVDTALEAQLGVALEIFVDASSADPGEPLAPYGWAKLAEHAGKAGLTATLRETSWFRYGDGYELGDRVRVQVGALDVEDVISQVDITHDARTGFSAVPKVGLATSDPTEALVEYVRDIAIAVGGQEKR